MRIRVENESDWPGVRKVHLAAFETTAEADLVEALRSQASPLISQVAEDRDVVGHIMFSPVALPSHPSASIMGLAPLAVMPDHQRRGVGAALVENGIGRARQSGVAAVFVLGHPEYYSRFGFVPARQFGIACEYDAPEEAFMAMELIPDALARATGTLEYHHCFANL